MTLFTDLTESAVERALDGVALRQRVTAQNIANAATPDYRAQRVDFESSLAAAIGGGDPGRAAVSTVDAGTPDNGNGNTVSMELETATQLRSGLQYQALVQAANYKLGLLRTAIDG